MSLADLRYALRSLARAPGFTLAVVLTLGLGIGANTAIFSVVRGVLLRPLPNRDGDRLVYLRQSISGPGGEDIAFSVPEINDIREGVKSLNGIAEYSQMTYTLQGKSDAVRMNVALVTGNYFQVMGLSTVAGRTLDPSDDGTKVAPVMVLTHDYWKRRFGGDRSIVGKTVQLDGRAVEVVGVAQPAPFFPNRVDALLNMVISEHHTSALMVQGRTHRMTEIVARLAPGATVDQARAEVAAVRAHVQQEFPDAYDPGSGYQVTLTPFQEVLGEKARLTLWLLMAAAAFVMIISCANVVNLTLMRNVRREHEMVVRAALGAGVARLRKLLLVENLVLAFLGAVLGLLLAKVGVSLLIALAERYSPRANEIRLDGIVLGFTLLLTLLVALVLSFAPRLAQEGKLGTWLTSGTTRSSGSLRKQRAQRVLVVAQIAVSVMLLTGAGLLTRTMQQLSEVDSGLTTEDVLTMEVPLATPGRTDADTKSLYDRMRLEVAAMPGVKEVGLGSVMPLRNSGGFQLEVKAEGRPVAAGEPMPRAEYRTASPEYFSASGIPLLTGREFLTTDRDSSGLVVILNQTLADNLFPDRDPIGQRVAWTGDVLRFIPVTGTGEPSLASWATPKTAVRRRAPAGDVPAVRPGTGVFGWPRDPGGEFSRRPGQCGYPIGRGIAPHDPIENVLTIAQIRDQSVAPRRLNAVLVSFFGFLALIIAAVGIAGVLAFW